MKHPFKHTAQTSDYIAALSKLRLAKTALQRNKALQALIRCMYFPVVDAFIKEQATPESIIQEIKNDEDAERELNLKGQSNIAPEIIEAYLQNIPAEQQASAKVHLSTLYYIFVRQYVSTEAIRDPDDNDDLFVQPAPNRNGIIIGNNNSAVLPNGKTKQQMADDMAAVINAHDEILIKPSNFDYYLPRVLIALAVISFIVLVGLTFGGVLPVASIPIVGPLYHAIAGPGSWMLPITNGISWAINKSALASAVSVIAGAVTMAMITTAAYGFMTFMSMLRPRPKLMDPKFGSKVDFRRIEATLRPVEYDIGPLAAQLYANTLSVTELDAQLKRCPVEQRTELITNHFTIIEQNVHQDLAMRRSLDAMTNYVTIESDNGKRGICNKEALMQARTQFVHEFGMHVTAGEIIEWKLKHPVIVERDASQVVDISTALLISPIHDGMLGSRSSSPGAGIGSASYNSPANPYANQY